MDSAIFFKIILALLLGAFIGLEREIHELNGKKSSRHIAFLGVRTFTLTTLLGTIAGYIFTYNPLFSSIIICSLFLLILLYYIFNSLYTKDIGITTEIALIFSFIIGILIALNIFPMQLVIGITVILTWILSRKEAIYKYVNKIGQMELNSFISYLVLALVILPFLPNISYKFADIPQFTQILSSYGIQLGKILNIEIINPFKLWQIVALITGVDVFGYILERTIGQKGGWLVTSFAGGFISSTATTQSLALQSTSAKSVNHLVSAAVIANLASFLQHAIIILPISSILFAKALPVIFIMLLSSFFLVLYFLRQSSDSRNKNLQTVKKKIKQDRLFNLYPALRFAILFILIKFFSQIALQLFGNNGFLVSIGFGAIPGIDAVLISIAELSGKTLTYKTALWAFIFANAINLSTKCIYSFVQGKREFAVKFSISAGIILLSGIFGFLVSMR